MLILITIHNEGFSQVKETKIIALVQTSTYQQSSEGQHTPAEPVSGKFLSYSFRSHFHYSLSCHKIINGPQRQIIKSYVLTNKFIKSIDLMWIFFFLNFYYMQQ